jgi:hypothetical protein
MVVTLPGCCAQAAIPATIDKVPSNMRRHIISNYDFMSAQKALGTQFGTKLRIRGTNAP